MKETRRVGRVIEVKKERLTEYGFLHSNSNLGVRDLLQKYNFHNYSIYITKFDNGKYYLFCYYEYTGENIEADELNLIKEPRVIEWLKVTDACQVPFKGDKSWTIMEEIYHNN